MKITANLWKSGYQSPYVVTLNRTRLPDIVIYGGVYYILKETITGRKGDYREAHTHHFGPGDQDLDE